VKSRRILNELLSLSQAHLQSGLKEDWEAWGKIFQAKKRHYEALSRLIPGRIDPEEARIISDIQALERQLTSLLFEKREEARAKTLQIKQVRTGVTGYRKVNPQRDQRHFNIKI